MKHVLAILVFALALLLQVWFAPAGMRGDFVLTVLIVFAFLFPLRELVIFILAGIFFTQASPYPDPAMFMLAIVPILVYLMRRHFPLDPWVGAAIGIAIGIPFFYAVVAPLAAFHGIFFLVFDILLCVLFGELVLWGINDAR